MIVPVVTASDCLFRGVRGFCVSVRVPLQLFLSCRFQSGICRLSPMGALLLIGRQDLCSCGFIWVFFVLSSYVFVTLCVCMTHDVCIMLGSSLVFLVFCYMLIGGKGLSYLFYHNNVQQQAGTHCKPFVRSGCTQRVEEGSWASRREV